MTGARARALRAPAEADVDAIVALLCACDVEDYGEPDYDAGALYDEWSDPAVDLARDAWVAVTEDGGIGGYAIVLGHDVRAWTDPLRRGHGIGTALLRSAEARALELGIATVRQQIAGTNAPAAALLHAAGYAPVAHHWRMGMSLDDRHREAPGPAAGITLRAYRPQADEELAYELIQGAFADVPGHAPQSIGSWRASGPGSSAFDPGLWCIAELDGTPAGALHGEARDGEGWVAEVGVARQARRRGVASALLGWAMAAFAERGLGRAGLSVRTANLAGVQLYESLGLRPQWRVDELEHRLGWSRGLPVSRLRP